MYSRKRKEDIIMNRKWKKFRDLTGKCYENMAGISRDKTCWEQAFSLLKEIIADERSNNAEFAPELYELDEVTDYEYDVQGWLEDYLDELDMWNDHEALLRSCEELLELFRWKKICSSDIQFMKVSSLNALNRHGEAVAYCRGWIEKEPDNIMAVTAGIYACISDKKMEEAEKLIHKYMDEDTECTEENDILFIAASRYYQAVGNKKEQKRIDALLEEYDRQLEEYFMEYEDDELLFEDDELPFC